MRKMPGPRTDAETCQNHCMNSMRMPAPSPSAGAAAAAAAGTRRALSLLLAMALVALCPHSLSFSSSSSPFSPLGVARADSLFDTSAWVEEVDKVNLHTRYTEGQPLLVVFYAPWCPHCRHYAPTWKAVAKSFGEAGSIVHFLAVNCIDQRDLCRRHDVRAYPTVKAFNFAGEKNSLSHDGFKLGARSESDVRAFVKASLEPAPKGGGKAIAQQPPPPPPAEALATEKKAKQKDKGKVKDKDRGPQLRLGGKGKAGDSGAPAQGQQIQAPQGALPPAQPPPPPPPPPLPDGPLVHPGALARAQEGQKPKPMDHLTDATVSLLFALRTEMPKSSKLITDQKKRAAIEWLSFVAETFPHQEMRLHLMQILRLLQQNVINHAQEWEAFVDDIHIPKDMHPTWVSCGPHALTTGPLQRHKAATKAAQDAARQKKQERDRAIAPAKSNARTKRGGIGSWFPFSWSSAFGGGNHKGGGGEGADKHGTSGAAHGRRLLPATDVAVQAKQQAQALKQQAGGQIVDAVDVGQQEPDFMSGEGYTCGLWKLFHILTVVTDKRHMSTFDAMEHIHTFVHNFFGCYGCAQHFVAMYEACEAGRCDVGERSGRGLVLWLWRVHNLVNRRIAQESFGADEIAEDFLWPSRQECPGCRARKVDESAAAAPAAASADKRGADVRQAENSVPRGAPEPKGGAALGPTTGRPLVPGLAGDVLWREEEVYQYITATYWSDSWEVPSSSVVDLLRNSALGMQVGYLLSGMFGLAVVIAIFMLGTHFLKRAHGQHKHAH